MQRPPQQGNSAPPPSRAAAPPPRPPPSRPSKAAPPASLRDMKRSSKKGQVKESKIDTSKVPKNAAGGVLVTPEELESAFRFLDQHGTGRITVNNLKKRLSAFYGDVPASQYKFLFGEKQDMTLKDLKDLLLDNTLDNFDPVLEAFKVYDPEERGFIDPHVLRGIFQDLELTKLTDEDLLILVDAADTDKDGKIGLQDFRTLSESARKQRQEEQQKDDPNINYSNNNNVDYASSDNPTNDHQSESKEEGKTVVAGDTTKKKLVPAPPPPKKKDQGASTPSSSTIAASS